ncbi:MAG: tocopherol cyclase family protein [Bdellovibrionota bacterium]
MLTQNERDNLVRWKPESGLGHVESYFLKANHPTEPRAFWLKFTLLCRPNGTAQAVGDVWAVIFNAKTHKHFAFRNQFPAKDCTLGREKVEIRMGKSEFHTGHSVGELEMGETKVSWNLHFTTEGEPFHHFPREALYEAKFPKSKALSPYPDCRYQGEIKLNGEAIKIDNWPGMQGHNWGEKHTDRYAWGHCNLFDGNPKDTFFEGFSGRIKVGGILIPPVTRVFLRHQGKNYPLLSAKSMVWPPAKIRYDLWEFEAEGGGYRLSGRLKADKQDMVGLYYKNPAGPNTDCLNSKLSSCDLKLTKKSLGRAETVCELTSPHGAALEVAVHEGENHGVRMTV